MYVVAVGDFDPQELVATLNMRLASIPNLELGAVPKPPTFPMGPGGRGENEALITQAHPQSQGVIYLRGDFAAPAPANDDYFATSLAVRIFSDMLFAVVRDTYGAVYTPSAAIRSYSANYGSIMIYKSNAPDRIKQYINEAAALVAAGRVVSVDPTQIEADGYMALADAIGVYKQRYINDYFEAVSTNAAIASLMIRSVLFTADAADWLNDQERIEMVDAKAVAQAFSRYVLNGALIWVAVGDQALLDMLRPKDFVSMQP